MAGPSLPTIKSLYSVSGNKCAFPKCNTPLVDATSGKVTGRICHIKASSAGGPRYDASQSDEERHGFENLLLMCPVHHDVIDADEEAYTVERLQKIKKEHQQQTGELKDVFDAIATGFVNNIHSNTINHGSIIFTQNQMGGQVAHSITNVGPQPRQISQAAANALVAELRNYPSESFAITCIMSDAETYQTASMIEHILKAAGWTTDGISQAVFTGLPRNIIIKVPQQKVSFLVLLNWFENIGFKPQGVLEPTLTTPKIIVGTALH
jgi:hypothetical protein